MKYEIECPYCYNKQVYKPRTKPPKQPHTKCKECKREFNFQIDKEENGIIETKKIIPGLDKTYSKKVVKAQFHEDQTSYDFTIDKDLKHFEGIELIKHTCEKVIKNKLITWNERLRALSIYVQYQDKAGTIKDLGTIEDQAHIKELRQLPNIELVKKLVELKGKSNLPIMLEEEILEEKLKSMKIKNDTP